jgi:putative transposase
VPATKPFERWSLDLLTDSLVDGRRFRVLTIVDNVSRVRPTVEVGVSLTGERVVGFWSASNARRQPQRGSPSITDQSSSPKPSMPGPTGTGSVGVLPAQQTDRQYLPNPSTVTFGRNVFCHLFASLEEARQTIEAWRIEYNTERLIERSDRQPRRHG